MDISFFKRGIKVESSGPPEEPLDVDPPARVLMPLRQCVGGDCTIVVEEGEQVKAGQKLAEGAGAADADLHAPFGATVAGFAQVRMPDGFESRALVLEADPSAGTADAPARGEPSRTPPGELRDQLARAGVVRGDREPKALATVIVESLSSHGVIPPTGKPVIRPVEHLAVLFCDADPHLATVSTAAAGIGESGSELATGIAALSRITGADNVHLVLDRRQSIPAAEKLADEEDWQVHRIDSLRYPDAAEPFVAKLVSGREPPVAFRQVHESGTLVVDVETVLDSARAVRLGKPVTERLITVTGPSGRKVVRAALGTPLSDIVEAAGMAGNHRKVVLGGPLDGIAHHTLDHPLTKSVRAITLFSSERVQPFDNRPCIGCGLCVQVCPVRLSPGLLSRYCEFDELEKAEEAHLFNCVECGCCAYVCPAGRSMVQLMIYGKSEILSARRTS
jgi:Na+-translocating ferredoxin:NAD+ oxidoreductase subunit C